jgi:hemerythrin-like metal-binding protein
MASSHFEWKEEYTVNVKIIDEQHKKLISIIDELYQSILQKMDKNILAELFKQLNDYSKYHFGTEEKYFQEFNYPDAFAHIAVHEKFKKDIVEMEDKMNTDHFNPFELLVYLENWWINHILDVDKRYSQNFNEHGLK